MIEDRWNAYRPKNWALFNHLKEKVKKEIAKAKQIWTNKVLQKNSNIWNVVREFQGKSKRTPSSPPVENLPRQLLELTASFSRYFNDEDDAEPCTLSNQPWQLRIDPSIIHKELRSLRFKQATGYDGISC